MTNRVLLASLIAGTLVVPATGASAAAAPEIKEIRVLPADPVVGPRGSVRVVIEVVARGVAGADGVSVEAVPGVPLPEPPTSGRGAGEGARALARRSSRDVSARGPAPGARGVHAPELGFVLSARVRPDAAPAGAARAPARFAGSAGEREDEWATWSFLPGRGLNRFYPSGLWTVTATARSADGVTVLRQTSFRLRHETRVVSVRAAKVPGVKALRIQGKVERVDPEGYRDYATFPGVRVEILRRGPLETEWSRVAKATTKSDGRFSRTVKGRAAGWWRVRYPGDDDYAAGWTAEILVDPSKKRTEI